jgi:hypothetical protein
MPGTAAAPGSAGMRSVQVMAARSGGLRGTDGDGAAGVELFHWRSREAWRWAGDSRRVQKSAPRSWQGVPLLRTWQAIFDLQWWTGWNQATARHALRELPVEEVGLHGDTGIALLALDWSALVWVRRRSGSPA